MSDLIIRVPQEEIRRQEGFADAFAALKMRTHLFRYFSGCPGAAALRARFGTVRTLADGCRCVGVETSGATNYLCKVNAM